MANHVPIGALRLLTARDGRACVWSASEGDALVPQHRQGGMGGRRHKHRLSNLLWLDSLLNGHIESDPQLQAIAKAWGIKISLHADPEELPVFFPHQHQWFRFTGNERTKITSLEALDRMHAFYGDPFFMWKAVAEQSAQAGILRLTGGRG